MALICAEEAGKRRWGWDLGLVRCWLIIGGHLMGIAMWGVGMNSRQTVLGPAFWRSGPHLVGRWDYLKYRSSFTRI